MKMISLPHKVCDYTCPINGFEDQYEWKTGQRLPDFLLFYVSSIGFLYLKQKNAPAPRMVFWGSGMGKRQYEFLADIIGYSWDYAEGGCFTRSLERVKRHIDQDKPVLLGLLDMYHLPYFQHFYHQVHIPEHFVLVIGYDDEAVWVQDNSRQEVQRVPYSDLEKAWDVNLPGRGKKNTFYAFQFQDRIAGIPEIVQRSLPKRAAEVLNPPVGFMGIPGMRKLAREFAGWQAELTSAQLDQSLQHLVTFTCSVVPMLPARLLPYPVDIRDSHAATRDRFAGLLEDLASEYRRPRWKTAARHFRTSGEQISRITDRVCDYLLHESADMGEIPALLGSCADEEERGFRLLLDE